MNRLLRNIRFGLEQWNFRKGQITFLALQTILSFVMLCYMFQNFYSYLKLNEQITHLMDGKEIFLWTSSNDNEWLYELDEEKYNKSFRTLIEVINETEAEIVVVNNSSVTAVKDEQVEIIEVTSEFFSKYQLKGDYSEADIQKYFTINYKTLEEEEQMIKPVVAGAAYAKQYKTGDIIVDDAGLKYQIIGFLDKGEVYSMPRQDKELMSTEHVLVTPVYIDLTDNDDIMTYIASCQFVVEDRQVLSEIEDTNFQLKLMDGYFISYSNQLSVIEADTQEAMLLYGGFGALLFLFSFIGIVGMMIQLLQEYEYEYGVNMLCGADIYDIFIRLVFQITLLIVVRLGITLAVFGFGKPFLHILGLAAVCVGLLYVYSWKRLKSSSILKNLRSCQ